MEKINTLAIIERAADGNYSVYMDDENAHYLVTGTGKTVEEAKAKFMAGYQDIKRVYEEDGKPFQERKFIFKFDIASLFDYYSMINVSAFARYLGINEALMRQYRKGGTYISGAQLKKIEGGINRLGKELSTLRLA